jgi:hypothetical protein
LPRNNFRHPNLSFTRFYIGEATVKIPNSLKEVQMYKDESAFRRMAGGAAIISAPVALGASLTLIMAIQGDPEIVANPVGMLTLGESVASILRRVEFAGMFGYYLLLVPATIYLWKWLSPRKPNLITVYTVIGLISITIGSIGSALLFSVWPPLISAYAQASQAQQEILSGVFRAFNDVVLVGLLPVSALLYGLWSLGIGLDLRAEKRALGVAAVVLGIIHIAYAVGANLQIELLASLEFLTFLAPVWALWLGIVIYRRDEHQPAFDPAERAELQGAEG